MAEYRFFDEAPPDFAHAAWFADRENVEHIDSPYHRDRLVTAARMAAEAYREYDLRCVVDVGSGDGGLLSQLPGEVVAWGYDVRAASVERAEQRGVDVRAADVLVDPIDYGPRPNLVVCTEMLEHLLDPHGFVEQLGRHADWLVASSPWDETPELHYEHHVWGWDEDGYADLLARGGFHVERRERVTFSQIVLATRT